MIAKLEELRERWLQWWGLQTDATQTLVAVGLCLVIVPPLFKAMVLYGRFLMWFLK